MKILPLAWAALWRNPTESLLLIAALSVGFALFGAMIAVNAAYQLAIDGLRMDQLIVACAFDCAAIPIGYREQLARITHVTAVAGQVWIGEHDEDARQPMTVMFVDEAMHSAWPELPMSSADWRALDTNPSGIFLTRKAAARRNLQIGDSVVMNSGRDGTADGSGIWYFTVLGFIPDPPGWGSGSGGPNWNPDTIVGSLRYMQNWGRPDESGFVNVMRVAVDRPESARAVCREIEAWYTNASPALRCVPAKDDAQELAEANINMRQISLGIAAAGLFMILFLCANGIAESVRERLREFATLKALGFGDGHIAALVVLEAAMPALLAAVIGGAVALGINAVVARLVIKGAINMPDVPLSLSAFALALVAALAIALLSAIAPLFRLRRTDVAAVIAGR
jgi:putative ABC transport system permease protein